MQGKKYAFANIITHIVLTLNIAKPEGVKPCFFTIIIIATAVKCPTCNPTAKLTSDTDFQAPVLMTGDGLGFFLPFFLHHLFLQIDMYFSFFPNLAWSRHEKQDKKAFIKANTAGISIAYSIPKNSPRHQQR